MKKITDSRLSTLWSRAVIAKYKRCPITGRTEGLQAHHVIPKGRQNRFALRWEIRNGCPLAPEAHRALHDGEPSVIRAVYDYMEERGDLEYITGLKHKLKDEFLADRGQTQEEYRKEVKEGLESALS